MSTAELEGGLQKIMLHFSQEHADIDSVFSKRCRQLAHLLPKATEPSPLQSLLIGAYFMSEYSLQSAALFNPSIVAHPDQEGIPSGALRFVMSLRATGEGHISSIEFRSGTISETGDLAFDPVSGSVTTPEIRYPRYRKADFVATCLELGIDEAFIAAAFDDLAETFDPDELETFLRHPERWPCSTGM
ncbi:MAG: glycosidase, partial [Alphaproteobacteria bacterium]|nr:glycosidase [Alphaproteobacteria bacterium]